MLISTVALNVYFIYGWEWFGTAQEAKAVVSVTVEGSVGLVKAMVRLGASVGEAIASVVERYAREGRSPCLDPAAACSRDLPTSPLSFEPSESTCTAGFSSGVFVKQMVNPALGRAHGLQWPHQGLTPFPQLPCVNQPSSAGASECRDVHIDYYH